MAGVLVFFAVITALGVIGDAAASGKFKKKSSFECPFEFGIFANPNNCRRFYTCNGFIPYDTPCPTPLYFDDAKKMCVYKTKDLQCGPVEIMSTEAPTTPDLDAAPTCVRSLCKLPDCFCSEDGTQIPGNLLPKETPQMIILAFSGALNVLNAEPFGYLLNETRMNPNGCPIKATFFVPHEYTSYYYVQKLYGEGHEIAMQTVTNRQEEFWSRASIDDYVDEVVGMKEILHTFSNISRDDLLGVRVPFMKSGGNNIMSMIYDYGLDYDSSLAAPLSEVPLWPYTFDFHMPHKCLSGNCPSRSFPGIWEFPLNTFQMDDGTGGTCVLLDQCVFPDDAEVIFDFLLHNFQTHYESNRAPLLMNLHVNWVTDESKISALDVFIDHVLENYPGTWFVTMQQALQWIRDPVPANMAPSFDGWKCPRDRQPGCNIPRTCAVKVGDGPRSEVRYMQLCGKCPVRYPWLDNIRGTREGKSVKDLVQKAEH